MYCLRPEQQPIFVFCVDVSPRALETGFTAACLAAVEASLDAVPGGDRARVGVMTFDKCLQVYRSDEEGTVSQMVVAPDTEVCGLWDTRAGERGGWVIHQEGFRRGEGAGRGGQLLSWAAR